jgi:hypothetical protein
MPQQRVGGQAAGGLGGLARMQSTSHASYGAFYNQPAQKPPQARAAVGGGQGQYGQKQYRY